MYVSMCGMLNRANKGNYAVMAINCFNLESARAVIDAAEKLRAPIIIDLLQEHMQYHLDSRFLIAPIVRMANEASIEVAINLDHGQNIGFVKRCLQDGFSSVMMDASGYPIEENIRITREMVEFAQTYNASVEGEVGQMGATSGNQLTNTSMYTDPDSAINFARKTGIDALAVSYGSSHGTYSEGYTPKFHFEIVEKIKKETEMPLVLHGGSGCGEENLRRSVRLGINKINMGTDFMKAQLKSIKDQLKDPGQSDYVELIHQTMESGKNIVQKYILIANSAGKSL
ncbi:MAG: ketose-bisphosphate aldolase [Sporolactobacillus sp.]